MPTTQQRYHEMLMERVRSDRYPSSGLLDRIEETLWTADQVQEYVDLLLEKIDASSYPSGQLMDRVQRMMSVVALAG